MADARPIATDLPLTANERDVLRRLAGIMIPASAEYGVPGADDERIFADILATAARSASTASILVRELDALAGASFTALTAADEHAVAERFRASGSELVAFFVALVAQCYYRDDRVMRSLDMEPRPPFPRGFELDDGEYSLLDPVRARPKLYREVPPR